MADHADNLAGKQFSYKPARDLAAYIGSYSAASQTLAIDGANPENIQSSGGGLAIFNGVAIASLPADAELDISADPIGDAAGAIISDGYDQYFAVFAAADGVLHLMKAGVQALLGTAVVKIPGWDASLYVCVGTMLIVNDSGSNIVIGTTALTGDLTFIDFAGPVLPYVLGGN